MAAKAMPDPRSLREEADYLPDDLDDLAQVYVDVVEMGVSSEAARGLVGWLLAKHQGLPDVTGKATRARYRKILAELDDHRSGPKRARRRRAQAGSAERRVLGAVAGAGTAAVGLATGNLALVALAPIIPDDVEGEPVTSTLEVGNESRKSDPLDLAA